MHNSSSNKIYCLCLCKHTKLQYFQIIRWAFIWWGSYNCICTTILGDLMSKAVGAVSCRFLDLGFKSCRSLNSLLCSTMSYCLWRLPGSISLPVCAEMAIEQKLNTYNCDYLELSVQGIYMVGGYLSGYYNNKITITQLHIVF